MNIPQQPVAADCRYRQPSSLALGGRWCAQAIGRSDAVAFRSRRCEEADGPHLWNDSAFSHRRLQEGLRASSQIFRFGVGMI